jgi:hypothetical protein
VLDVSCGRCHTVFVTGTSFISCSYPPPSLCLICILIASLSLCLSDHPAVSGAVYATGAGAAGQMGCGYTIPHRTPARLTGLTACCVVAVACGEYFSAALTGTLTLLSLSFRASVSLPFSV